MQPAALCAEVSTGGRSAAAALVDAVEGGHGRQRHRLDDELADRLAGLEPADGPGGFAPGPPRFEAARG